MVEFFFIQYKIKSSYKIYTMPKAKSLKKKGGSCQVNFPISKSPCFDVDVSQYKSPCKHLPLDSAQIKAQTGGKKSARKNKKRNLRKNKKSFKKKKQKGGRVQ